MRLRFARQIEIIFVEIVYIEWRSLFLSGNYWFICFIQFQSRNCNSLWTVQFLFENCGSRTVMQFPFGNCIAPVSAKKIRIAAYLQQNSVFIEFTNSFLFAKLFFEQIWAHYATFLHENNARCAKNVSIWSLQLTPAILIYKL